MGLRINNSNISQMKINGVNIQLAKINGSIVFEINGEIITLSFNDKTISAISNRSGSYDFYYGKDGEILEDYDKIVSFDLIADTESSYECLNSFNIAPYNANEIVVCKSGTTNILSSSSLPSQFLFDSSKYGSKLYSFGALSDVHIDGDGNDQASASGDFARALNFFNSNANLVAISGDLCNENGYNELSLFKSLVDTNSSIPVYASRGNHDCRYTLEEFETYIGGSLYFERTYNNDVFIFLGMNAENYRDSCFTTEEIDWLETKLETYKNQRVFLFFHVFMTNTCGNINGLYPYSSLISSSSIISRFVSLMTTYKNVIYFSGHSHLEFACQRFGANANIFSNGTTCHRVHIPSCAKPRKNDAGLTSSDTYNYDEGSEGYLVDVYENCIVLRGRDFIKGKFLPIANYCLDTTPIISDEEEIVNLLPNFPATSETNNGTTSEFTGEDTNITITGTATTSYNRTSWKVEMPLEQGKNYICRTEILSGTVDASNHDNEIADIGLRGYTDNSTYDTLLTETWYTTEGNVKEIPFTISSDYVNYCIVFRYKSNTIYDNLVVKFTIYEVEN